MEAWVREYPGVYRWDIGEQVKLTPRKILGNDERAKQLSELEEKKLPVQAGEAKAFVRKDGVLIRFPASEGERYYGLGLQLQSFLQNGKRKRLAANADAVADTGDSHAPVPFFVSSAGYGILIDSAGTVEFDFGCSRTLHREKGQAEAKLAGTNTQELYANKQRGKEITVFLRGAKGVSIYCFAGGSIKGSTELYNLYCGGGCMPPLWGLGSLYRCYTRAMQEDVERLGEQFFAEKMPFSMIGLEPGWHSHSYSCSFSWSDQRFPDPDGLIERAQKRRMKVNIWEQAFVHPTAPFYDEIAEHSGDYEVWGGAVPDFADEKACEIYGAHQEKLFLQGIAAVKLDECDGADFTGGWFFPDYAGFPSGLTGEEAKNMYGAMVIRAIQRSFERLDRRTWSQVRANYSYGAPMPYVLYSDLYEHEQFVRGVCNSGFSGLLWSPEVRQCHSEEELLRRMQAVIFSPLSLVNAWMIPNPPWKQYETEKNKAGVLLEDSRLQDSVRELLELRNRLVPYLYSAFWRYEQFGTPPFRPLVMEFPDEEALWEADDCYMMGDALLVAPVLAKDGTAPSGRQVYLPKGIWYDFWTGKQIEGGSSFWMETEKIPVFVRDNSMLPLAMETQAPGVDSVFSLEIRLYGEPSEGFVLVEDDGESFAYRRGEQRLLSFYQEDGCWKLPDSFRYRVERIVDMKKERQCEK